MGAIIIYRQSGGRGGGGRRIFEGDQSEGGL